MIQNLVDKIELDVGYDVNIVNLAASFKISPWHFQRLFKSVVGDSLGSYVRGRRLSIASQKLLNSDVSIINIAFDVGFNSHESFTRSFKAYFGHSPKDFRSIKPKVLTNKKPLLTAELLEHITNGMHQEPIIVDIAEQILVGFEVEVPSPFATDIPICNLVMESWFSLFERENEIKNRTKHTYYGLNISPSGTFTEDRLKYIAGAPTLDTSEIPKGMSRYTLPKQKVAIFDTKTNIEAEVAKRTIDYIYGYWLPNSKYERDDGDDYELFEDVYDFTTGKFSSKYVVPIV